MFDVLHLQVTNLAEEVEALRRQVTEGEPAQKVSWCDECDVILQSLATLTYWCHWNALFKGHRRFEDRSQSLLNEKIWKWTLYLQVEHLDTTVRELQDSHEDLKKKAATCTAIFSNHRQSTPPSFDWVVTWTLEAWAQVEKASSAEAEIADLKQQAGKMVRNILELQCLWVLEGVWQLVSLKSDSCTCIVWFLSDMFLVSDQPCSLAQVKGLGETVAKTAETLNRSESQSEVRTSRVAFGGSSTERWSVPSIWVMQSRQKFRYFELRDAESWERPKVSKLKEAFEAMKRRQEEFNLQTEVRRCTVQQTNTVNPGSFSDVQATQRKQLNTIREDMRNLA